MKKNGRKRNRETSKETEDWCFACKDGGDLVICDHWDCSKVYHTECVDNDSSALQSGKRWICDRHTCHTCDRNPKYYCFGCPNSVCEKCIGPAKFADMRGKDGFCQDCLKLVLLAEQNADYDSDGEKVDFKDRDTYECLFKEYWEILKEKQGLTKDVACAAYQTRFSNKFRNSNEEDLYIPSDSDDNDEYDIEKHKLIGKKKKSKKGKEFIGWGSKPLIEFLKSINIETTKPLSQYDVDSIILKYIHEKNLIHPVKKRKVVCDQKLYAVFRKSVISNKCNIFNLLWTHFAENVDQLEDEIIENGYKISSLENPNGNINTVACKKQKTLDLDRKKSEKKKLCLVNVQKSCFASTVAHNINLVYLRRSLVEELLKQPESFEGKVVGSFVKIKTDLNDKFRRNSHQILQVQRVNKTFTGEINSLVVLQVCNVTVEIQISKLSDFGITEEECEDLREKVKNGLLKRLTIVEIEQKARVLYEDIMKHWIKNELVVLQNRIDCANEKGRRRELLEYMEQRELLKKPSEQERLLKQAPAVIAELIELEPSSIIAVKSSIAHEIVGAPFYVDLSSDLTCDNA